MTPPPNLRGIAISTEEEFQHYVEEHLKPAFAKSHGQFVMIFGPRDEVESIIGGGAALQEIGRFVDWVASTADFAIKNFKRMNGGKVPANGVGNLLDDLRYIVEKARGIQKKFKGR